MKALPIPQINEITLEGKLKMDGNTLIEVIKTELPVISSSVSAIVGAIITTLFLRKNTSTTEFEKVKAGKFSLVIDQLLESGKMSYLEYYRCRNFLSRKKSWTDWKRN